MFGNLERGDKGNQQLIKSPCSHFNAASARPPPVQPQRGSLPTKGRGGATPPPQHPSSAFNFLVDPAPLPPLIPDLVPESVEGEPAVTQLRPKPG